jgi:hypothetical protein
MPESRRSSRMSDIDRLRNATDSGRTGDKVPFPDPAAAPLGTDAEAGGSSVMRAPSDARVLEQRGIDAIEAPAVSDESGRRIDGELTPQGERRLAALTLRGVAVMLVIGVGVVLVVFAMR